MGWGEVGGVGAGGGGRALGEGFVIRVVLGLSDGAGDGEKGYCLPTLLLNILTFRISGTGSRRQVLCLLYRTPDDGNCLNIFREKSP